MMGKSEIIKKNILLFAFFIFSALVLISPYESRAAGDFQVTLDPSRTQGVAPLSVFFDVTATPSISDGSYINTTCAWNFDTTDVDTQANYRTGSGFVAAHVFENPGTYTVSVNIYTPSGQHAWETVTITVSAFSGTTYYVATDGHDNNDGLSTSSPFETVGHALTDSHVQPNTRILFKNGDTFYVSNLINIENKTGPIIIGGYSDPADPSSSKPIIYATCVDSAWATLNFDNSSDIRIMDIAVRATAESSDNPRYPFGIGMYNNTSHILKYRTEEYLNGGMSMSPCGRYNTIAECSFHDTTQTGYCSGEDDNSGNAVIGNRVYDKNLIDQSNEEHIFRLQGGRRWYIAHNTFGPNVRVNYDTITIRGDSDKIVIYKNTIFDYVTAIWPQNRNSAEEYQHHCIIDSNLFIGSENNSCAIGLHSKDIVVRNNIFYNYQYGIGVGNDTVVGPSQRVNIYNNTMINPANSNSERFILAHVDSECFDIAVYNNLMVDVAGTSSYTGLFDFRGSITLNGRSDNNVLFGPGWNATSELFDGLTLSAWQVASENDLNSSIADPSLINIDINASSSPNFSSPSEDSTILIDNGAFSGTALDYHGNLRDLARDIGAVEYIGGSTDLVSPTAPAGLTATPSSSSAIDLTWSAATDNVSVAGYRIYRDDTVIAATIETTFQNTGCEPSASYDYTIRAYDAVGNISQPSNTASATTTGQSGGDTANTGGDSGSSGGCFIATAKDNI